MLLPVGKGGGAGVLVAGEDVSRAGFGSGVTGTGYPGTTFGSMAKQPLGVLANGVRLEYIYSPQTGGVLDFFLNGTPTSFSAISINGVNYVSALFTVTNYAGGVRRYRYSFGGSTVLFVDGQVYTIRFE